MVNYCNTNSATGRSVSRSSAIALDLVALQFAKPPHSSSPILELGAKPTRLQSGHLRYPVITQHTAPVVAIGMECETLHEHAIDRDISRLCLIIDGDDDDCGDMRMTLQ